MKEEGGSEFEDVVFLHDLGIPLEKIAKAKKISLDKVKLLIGTQENTVKTRKMNIVQEIANQNPWKNQIPPDEILEIMAEHLEAEERHDGARTIPSKPIQKVDRSERLGEDRGMADRIEASKASSDAPKVLKEIVESATIAKRKRDRKDWEDAKSGVSKLFDDDLDI